MDSYIQYKELENQFQSNRFALSTQRQIAKDFATAGIFFSSDFESTPFLIDRIVQEISSHLKELQSISTGSFSQLLYQIDVPESILPDLAQSVDFYSILAEVILRREAYKVYLRNKFSS